MTDDIMDLMEPRVQPSGAAAPAKHSGPLAPNVDKFPAELRALPRWVLWKYESGGDKMTKVPYAAKSLRNASSKNPDTWASYDDALAAYKKRKKDFAGLGFVLNGDGLVGVDIDKCFHDGHPDGKALELLGNLEAAYIEVSPSGTGLRAFGYAENLVKGVSGSCDGLKVELYTNERYLTVTGCVLKAEPLRKLIGFQELAHRIGRDRKVNPETGEIEETPPNERQAELLRRILSGDVFHDSLRDFAASMVATGMHPGAAVNFLYAAMDNSAAPRDARWKARRDEIPDLVKSAHEKYAPLDFPDMVEKAKASNEPRYKLLSAADLLNLPPLQWRVRGVLPTEGLAALYGPSGGGKSFLAFDLAAAIAEGSHWFDCRVKAAPVVYAALEGESGYKQRVQAWQVYHGRPLPKGLRVMLQPVKLTEEKDLVDLAAVVPEGAVVIVDTLNRAAPTSDENSSKDMGAILEAAKRLQSSCGGLVLVVHHTGKNLSAGLRGHSSLFAALDAAIELSDEGGRKEWKVAKSKDGQGGIAHPFKLQVQAVDVEETGEAVTSCVVVRDTAAQDLRAVKLPQGGNQRLVFDALQPLFEGGTMGKPGAPPFHQCIQLEAAVSAGAAKMTCPTDKRNSRARDAIKGLVGRSVLGCHEGWLWKV